MTVSELIALLQQQADQYGGDTPVRVAYPSGDYWRTTLAADPRRVKAGTVAHSDYHGMDTLVEDEDCEEGTTAPGQTMAIVIR